MHSTSYLTFISPLITISSRESYIQTPNFISSTLTVALPPKLLQQLYNLVFSSSVQRIISHQFNHRFLRVLQTHSFHPFTPSIRARISVELAYSMSSTRHISEIFHFSRFKRYSRTRTTEVPARTLEARRPYKFGTQAYLNHMINWEGRP